jgi:hypothetical protein
MLGHMSLRGFLLTGLSCLGDVEGYILAAVNWQVAKQIQLLQTRRRSFL